MLRSLMPCLAAMVAAPAVTAGPPAVVTYDAPTYDRWVYPFNSTPGTRIAASVFGTTGEPAFDNRDGQVLLTWLTGADVPVGLGPDGYVVTSLTIHLTNDNDLVFTYDDTTDPYTGFLDPSDPDYVPDEDPGEPIELFGVGFRSGFDLFSFGETGPHGPIAKSSRNAFALGFDGTGGAAIDISNHVEDRFTPSAWAIGVIPGLTPGDLVPFGSTITLDVDVTDPDVQAYLGAGLNAGGLGFVVTSMTRVTQMGGPFPSFFMKEHPFVVDGFAQAARLEFTWTVASACPGDLDGDDVVGFSDLVLVLSSWGACPECPADLDDDGVVGFTDLVQILSTWGTCP